MKLFNIIKSYSKRLKWWAFWTEYFSYEKVLGEDRAVLEIGSGKAKIPGVLTIDINPAVTPDILHDLDRFPWPVADSTFDAVIMFSVIEHLGYPVKAIEECHRILKPNGKIYLLTPHFSDSGSFIDPTHKWHFSARSFDYFISGTSLQQEYGFYSPARFRLARRLVSLKGFIDRLPFVQKLVNKNLAFWEGHLCFFVRGAGIYIELEKKDSDVAQELM